MNTKQTKPSRRLGADITQSTLQLTLDNAGIERSITDLSYMEKRLVIVASLLKQTKESQGDWGRTIGSIANQMRIFQQQTERLTRALGNVFLPILKKILPYLNGFLMALTEIINFFAVLVGYNEEEFDFFGSSNADILDLSGSVGGLSDNLDKASKNAKELQSGLRSFDKLNNITTPSANGVSSSIGGGFGGLDPRIANLFNKSSDDYLKQLENIKMRANDIRDSIINWLGFTREVDEETGKVSLKFDHLTLGTILGGLVVGGTLLNGLSIFLGIFSKLSGLKFAGVNSLSGSLAKIGGSASTLAGKIGMTAGGSGTLIGSLLLLDGILVTLATKTIIDYINTIADLQDRVSALKSMIESGNEAWKKNSEELVNNAKQGKYNEEQRNRLAEGLLRDIENTYALTDSINSESYAMQLFSATLDDNNKILDSNSKAIFNNLQKLNNLNEAGKLSPQIKEKFADALHIEILRLEDENKKLSENSDKYKDNAKKIDILKESLGKINKNYVARLELALDTDKAESGIEKFLRKISSIFGGGTSSSHTFETGGILINDKWHNIQNYASGGLPPVGQMFVAREKGPELVGQIGSHTAIMNNDQIVGSVSAGVYQAVRSAMNSNSNQTFNIYLDKNHKLATYTLKDLQNMAKSNGEPITIGK